jgi:hypothetical protein
LGTCSSSTTWSTQHRISPELTSSCVCDRRLTPSVLMEDLMRHLVTAALAILFVAALDAQQPGSLDDRMDIFNVPNPLPPCGIDRPLMRLAQTARVLIGFETTPERFRNPIGVPTITGPDDLKDVTARQVLNDLMALGPGYCGTTTGTPQRRSAVPERLRLRSSPRSRLRPRRSAR